MFSFAGASRFVEENTELPFQDTVIKLSIESVAEEPSHVSISESSQGGSSVILIKGFPEKTNERQLKTFLIHCAKERKVKIGIGNIFIWQGSAYVKTTNKKGKCK